MGGVTTQPPEDESDEQERADAHLDGVDPGAGCTEIWEHLSEHRDAEEE